MKQAFSKYLSLEPYEFDQGDHGWRELDEKGKFLEAAQVIEDYLKTNKEKVRVYAKEKPGLASVMVFHAGQLYATAGPQYYATALPFLKKSLRPSNGGWNLYVKGTVAFLEGDIDTLNKCLDSLKIDNPKHIHVSVLGKLRQGLRRGMTYQQAYDSN